MPSGGSTPSCLNNTACGTNGYCLNGSCVECSSPQVPKATFDGCETPIVCDARTTSSCTGTESCGSTYTCTPGKCDQILVHGSCSTGYCVMNNNAYYRECPLFDAEGNYIGYISPHWGVEYTSPDGTVHPLDEIDWVDERYYPVLSSSCLEWDRETGPTGTVRQVSETRFSNVGLCGGG